MNNKIILASKSEVRKKILYENSINCEVIPAYIDEEEIKKSLLNEGANPLIVSKNLAELKANKISKKAPEKIVNHEKSKLDDFIIEREKIIANIEMLK